MQRGFRHPPSLHIDRLRDAPVGHYFDVIRMDSELCQATPRAFSREGPLGHHRLCTCVAVQPEREGGRSYCGGTRETGARSMNVSEPTIPELESYQWRALAVGRRRAFACVVLGALVSPEQFFRSYLVGYVFWTGVALGCLSIAMLHQLVGGGWGEAIRRLLDSGARTLPVMLVSSFL